MCDTHLIEWPIAIFSLVQEHFFVFFGLKLSPSSFRTNRRHRCRPFSPTVLAFNFYRAWGSAIPLLVDYSSSAANSRSRTFRKSICAQEQVPTDIYEYVCTRWGSNSQNWPIPGSRITDTPPGRPASKIHNTNVNGRLTNHNPEDVFDRLLTDHNHTILPIHIIKIEIHSSCEIEYFVKSHLCKLCVILRSHVVRVVCPH